MHPTCITTTFQYNILCVLAHKFYILTHTCSTYWTTARLSEMSILYVRAGCEIHVWLASYTHVAPNMHCSVFSIRHLCILTHIVWKLLVVHKCSAYRMTALLSETFLEWFRVACVIRLESYSPRHTSVVLWYNNVCVYRKPVDMYIHVREFCCHA